MLDRLIQFSLKHRLIVTVVAAFIVVYGGFVLLKMPVDVFPDLNRPIVTIMTESEGMAPEEVETLVTLPLETTLNGLPGVERLRSASGIGLSVIYVEFSWGSDIYRNRQMVAEKLSQASEKLPRNIVPIMAPISSIMGEIQLIGLSSPDGSVAPMDLRSLADWTLRPRLLSIPGVSQVIAIGGGVKQYQILLNSEKMNRLQLTIEEVEKSLSSLGRNTTGGFTDIEDKEFLIRNIGSAKSLDDIKQYVVGMHLGRPVTVAQIAEVKNGVQTKRGDASVNGKAAVILSIQKQPTASTIELTKKIKLALTEFSAHLPKGVEIQPHLFQQADFIEASVDNVVEALRDGTILVAIVLFLFLLNFRTTLITLTAIPLSFLLTAIVFHWFGLSINTMTLGGLAVAIGELVDDAIVDVENVYRRLNENRKLSEPKPILQVVYAASSEVRNSIVYATIIVVLVFIPLFQLEGIEGRLFAPLGIAYIVSLIASLFVSLTVTPVLASFLFAKSIKAEHEEGRFTRALKALDFKLLHKVIERPKIIVGITLLLLISSLCLLPFMGKEFLPKFNEGTATIGMLAQPGISLEASNKLGLQAEKLILEIPEVKSVSRRTGRAELDEHAEGVHSSEIDVDFKEGGRNREIVLEELRTKLKSIDGAFVNVGQPISHRLDHLLSGVRAQIAIKLFGPDLATLRGKASEISQALAGTKGLVDLQVEQQVLIPQIKIHYMRDQAEKFGISLGQLSEALEESLRGKVVSEIVDGQTVIRVFMKLDEVSRKSAEEIGKIAIKVLPTGQQLKLSDVADIYEADGPNAISRENTLRRIVVSANAAGRDLDSLVKELQDRVTKKVVLPEGYFLEYGGQFESQQKASRTILLLGILSLLGIFFVLYSHFKSTFIAIQIMLNIPMALIGSIVAVYLTDKTLSVASLVAFVTLCGISSRNGIMMISHYLHLMKHEGEGFTKEMVIRGSLERLVPVLMTALTAILGLLPLVLAKGAPGKEILHPVAVVIVGGLISSTLLDMIVTPTVFFNFGRKSALRAIAQTKEIEFEKVPH